MARESERWPCEQGSMPPKKADKGRSPQNGGSKVPTVLVRLFGSDHVCSLHAALRCLLAGAAPRLETLRRGDTPAYRHLLTKTLVVSVEPRPLWQHVQPLPAATSCQALCSQAQAVARAAALVARQGGFGAGGGNVLCAGDGLATGAPRGGRQGPAGAPAVPEYTKMNSAAQALLVRFRRCCCPVAKLSSLLCALPSRSRRSGARC